jgi:hypothetical protein
MTMTKAFNPGRGGLLKQGTVAIGREPIRVPVAHMPPRRPAAAAAHPEGEPQVQLHRADDGSVRAITVRCTCGREVTLQCEYLDEGGTNEG